MADFLADVRQLRGSVTGLKIKIGGSTQEDGAAFVEVWHRIENGDKHVTVDRIEAVIELA